MAGVAEENKAIGMPSVGGPFKLIDHNGKEVTQETYAGKHTLVGIVCTS
jgi:protein SCO1